MSYIISSYIPDHRTLFSSFLLSASALALASPAHAISEANADDADASAGAAAADDSSNTDLIVIGRPNERVQEVQATPISITSLSGDKLNQQGITNVRELGNIVPNLFQPRTAVSYLNSSFFLRGVGESDAQGEPSVAVYVDGIYVPKNLGSQQELLDIERVEVFRGPQGQAFGHSAAGGAILITTNVPGETPVLKAQLGYGTYNDTRAGIAVSGPLANGVYGGLSLSYHYRDGFDRNVTVGRDVNTIDYLAGRTKLRFVPNDKLDILFTVAGVRDRSTARGVQNLLFNDQEAHNQIFPYNQYEQWSGNVEIKYQINDQLRLRSLSGLYGFNQTAFFDNTGDYYGRGSQWVRYEDRTYQEELQLIGNFGWLDVTTGAYFYREEWFTNRRANTARTPNTSVTANIRYTPVYSAIQQNTENIALYGEAKLHPTDALTLTGGLRYNSEKHTQDNRLSYLSGAADRTSNAANFLEVIYSDPKESAWTEGPALGVKSWDTWSPKFAIDYRWSPAVLTYASYSQGTKSAGFDYRAQTPGSNGYKQAVNPYNPERVTNYEVGIKTEWLGGRLRANLTGFYIDFKDVQITTTDPVLGISRRFNAGQASTRGLEFEATAIPVDGLQFDLNVSYLDARLDSFGGVVSKTTYAANAANPYFPSGFTINNSPFAGATLPNSPEWQGRVASTWKVPVNLPGALVLQGDVNYQSSTYTDANNNFSALLPTQTYVNAQVSYTTEDQHWTGSISARNLANVRYAQGQGYTPDAAGLPVYRSTNYNDPLTVLFTITYKR
ncbi:MAG TPA: TonB-dependent receptor [Sphingobium sp.]